jgi:hypothetical protein
MPGAHADSMSDDFCQQIGNVTGILALAPVDTPARVSQCCLPEALEHGLSLSVGRLQLDVQRAVEDLVTAVPYETAAT